MFKFLILGVLLCHGINEISGLDKTSLTDTLVSSWPPTPQQNTDGTPAPEGNNGNFSEDQLPLAVVPFYWRNITGSKKPMPVMLVHVINAIDQKSSIELSNSVKNVGKELSSEYIVTKGIGAHKLHIRQLSWNNARKVCIDEGGQLADIRSDSEEKIIQQLLVENSVEFAWVGYHDIFGEGDWVSVLGEPLGSSGWARWWKKRLPNPNNNEGNENCACLMRDGGGMNDNTCSKEIQFVCKITLS